MPDMPQNNKLSNKTEDFLLAEYKSLSDAFWRNEEAGERRVSFFITFVTAVITALVAFASGKTTLTPTANNAVILFALFGLLVLGVVTFLRMVRRNEVTNEYKAAMRKIRGWFKNEDGRLQNYDPFPKNKPRGMINGGLVYMIATINSLVAMAFGAFVMLNAQLDVGFVALISLVSAVIVFIVQHLYAQYRESESRKNGQAN